MEDIKLVLKGFIVGIGKIIPGISGAMLAISLGIYEKAIGIISNIKTELFKNIKFVFLLGMGVLLSIVLFGNLINFLLSNFYLPTTLLFIGLICGTIPNIFKDINQKEIEYIDIILLIFSFSFVIGITFLKNNEIFNIEKSYIGVFIIGLIDAATMIIPGISGTAILLILGCYDVLLSVYANIFNMSEIIYTVLYGIGAIVGILMFAKIMNFLFVKHRSNGYFMILGFMVSSIIILLYTSIINSFEIVGFIIGVILFVIGMKIALLLDK